MERHPHARLATLVRRPSIRILLPLMLILGLALGLRLYGLQWDQGNFFHPDERSIYMRVDCMHRVLTNGPFYQDCIRDFPQTQPGVPTPAVFLDADRSPLNPHWFPLGSIIIYMLLIVKVGFSPIATMDLQDLALAGRTLSALADTGSIALVFLLGRRLYGSRVGLLAAALMALAVVHIQQSHFYRPETFIVLLTLASFLFMLRVAERRRLRDSLLLGLFVGLAFATKVSAVPLLLPLALTYGYRLSHAIREPPGQLRQAHVRGVVAHAFTGGLVAAVVFLFWMPYAVLDLRGFLEWTAREADIIRNPGDVPYTVQYIGATPVLYELRQTVVWALGAPLGVVAWGGFLFAAVRSFSRPRQGELLLLAWAVLFFLTVVPFEVKFLRYVFPLMPVLILLGARLLVSMWDWSRANMPRMAPAAAGLMVFVLLATAFYAFAFERVYTRPHTAVQASRWINANVPPGTAIVADNHWDEGIPDLGRYRVTQIPMYEGDTSDKMQFVANQLADSQYLVAYSNRLYGSIPRVPERYPLSSQYYRLLFSGELGYRLEKVFTSYPRFLGVAFVDDTLGRPGLPVPEALKKRSVAPLTLNLGYADENVMDYDHPMVLVFKNVEHRPAVELSDTLVYSDQAPPLGLMLSPEDLEVQRSGGTWSALFDPKGLTNRFPVVIWLLVVEAIALAALPLTLVLLRFLPDRGFLLARPLGILLVAYLVWLGTSLGWFSFSRGAIVAALLLVAAASGLVFFLRRQELLSFLRRRWRYLALAEGLFLAAFFAFLVIRLANPDLWHPFRGGEKPMDFAYLNALVKSTAMSPYDPWFGGGYLNYYYFGQFIVGALIKVTGIVPAVAYNLAVPLLFALTVTGAFTVVYNLTEALRRRRYSLASTRGPVLAGLAAILLVAVLGNLDGAIQLVQGTWDVVVKGEAFPRFDFWRSSRMMPGQISITEFPFWTFLFADLHAHLIVIPFTLLALGVALNFVLAGGDRQSLAGRGVRLLALALTVGAFAAINTWELPTYVGIGVAALFIAAIPQLARVNRRRLLGWGIQAGLFVVLAYILFLPYHASREGFYQGVKASQWQTSFHHYLAIHGLFFILALTFLAVEAVRRFGWRPWLIAPPVMGIRNGAGYGVAGAFSLPMGLVGAGAAAVLVAVLVSVGYATAAVLVVLLAVCVILAVRWLLAGGAEAPLHLYALLLLGLAFAIGAGVDLVTMEGDIDRMNTVFKFYLQAWVLYGVAGAFILWYLAASGALRPWRRLLPLKIGGLTLLALLVVSSSIYPILGTRARLADRFEALPLTLDGTAFMENAVYADENGPIPLVWDAQAIRWMQENIEGSPVVVEAITSQYRWGGRVSIYTGLPAVLGWPWHQTQQRAAYTWAIHQRERDVRTIYSTRDAQEAMRLLRKYDVSYVYVGPAERLYYPEEGLAKIERMADASFGGLVKAELEVAYRNPQVTIYRVLPEGGI